MALCLLTSNHLHGFYPWKCSHIVLVRLDEKKTLGLSDGFFFTSTASHLCFCSWLFLCLECPIHFSMCQNPNYPPGPAKILTIVWSLPTSLQLDVIAFSFEPRSTLFIFSQATFHSLLCLILLVHLSSFYGAPPSVWAPFIHIPRALNCVQALFMSRVIRSK